jgi:hypothetical protein
MVHAFRSGSVPCAPPAACGIGGHAGAGPVRVIQAYRFALEPSPAQERDLRSHAGASRFAWNWGLARVRERYAAEGTWYSGIDLHKMWNAAKKADPALAWWSENSKWAYQEAFNDLHRALRDFDKSRKGLRKGKRLGFPKAKKRGRGRSAALGRRSPCPVSARSARMSPPASWPVGWPPGRPASCRPPSPAPRSAGSCRSLWRWSARSRSGMPGRARRSVLI